MMVSSSCPLFVIIATSCCCSSVRGVSDSRRPTPSTAFIGVRISWDWRRRDERKGQAKGEQWGQGRKRVSWRSGD